MSSVPFRPADTRNSPTNVRLKGYPTHSAGASFSAQQEMNYQGSSNMSNGPMNLTNNYAVGNAVPYQNNVGPSGLYPSVVNSQPLHTGFVPGMKQNMGSYANQVSPVSQPSMYSSNTASALTNNSNNPMAYSLSPNTNQPTRTSNLRASPYTLGGMEGSPNLPPTSYNNVTTQSSPIQQGGNKTYQATEMTSPASQSDLQSSTSVHPVVGGRRRQYPKQVPQSIPMANKISGNGTAFHPVATPNPMMTGSDAQGITNATQGQLYQQSQDTSSRSAGQSPTPFLPQASSQDMARMNNAFGRMAVESHSYPLNLMEQRAIVPATPIRPPKVLLQQDLQKKNVDPDIFRCTLNSIPQSSSLLSKCKLPLGVYIHPFKETESLPIITSSVITRCTSCRTYLNPFVTLVDQRRWQCNLCYRMNEIPEKLCYDHITRGYIDPRKRPELNSASIEFVAPAEYMLRPPQPAVFLFAFDASFNAVETGYLSSVCRVLKQNLDNIPGDARTMVGFLTFNSSVHFYSLKTSQPQMMIVSDIEDMFIPTPDGLLVNLKENKEAIIQLLDAIPGSFADTKDMNSATGATVQIARKLMQATGGRVTVFQTCLPNIGPGKLERRECPNMQGSSKDSKNLGPSTDFYKKIALECAGDQIAIDLYLLTGQYSDLATLSCASRYSSGCVYYYPEFHFTKNPAMTERFENDFCRYLTRPIGFEAVMRVRCTKGLAIHTFHGNCFVRSTDLLSLPNVNPDHSFGMQISIEESLADTSVASFQAALLYTTSKGERRIRVHTLAVPITSKISDVYASADQQAIIRLLGKMAVDRTLMSSLGDAREALMNACQDCLSVYSSEVAGSQANKMVVPSNLALMPLYTLALLKHDAFRLGTSVSLDARYYAMMQLKTMPLVDSTVCIYPRMYQISDLADENVDRPLPILNCSAERYNRQAIYMLDAGTALYIFIGKNVSNWLVQQLLNINSYAEMPDDLIALPDINTRFCMETKAMIEDIRLDRARYPELRIIREESRLRILFIANLVDDRSESVMSYQEFLLHLQKQLTK